jgi:23S rRNA pseudouridine1911/1915/1917 synthase
VTPTHTVLFEDTEMLIVNKLGPIPVQPDKTGDLSLQERIIADSAARGGRYLFLEAAHRIDRRVSGIVLFAKTPKALTTLEAAFRARRIEKEYVACVEREPEPPEGELEHTLVWDKRRNIVTASESPNTLQRGKKAALEYRLIGRSERYFFLALRLITGRHHQIRAQLSAIGCPIRGDLKYGARRSTGNGLIMLHARRLVLDQPRTGARIECVAPFPETEALWKCLEDC